MEKVTLENNLDEREKGSHGMSESIPGRAKSTPHPPTPPTPRRAQWECAWEVGSWRPGCLWGEERGQQEEVGE